MPYPETFDIQDYFACRFEDAWKEADLDDKDVLSDVLHSEGNLIAWASGLLAGMMWESRHRVPTEFKEAILGSVNWGELLDALLIIVGFARVG